VSPKLFLLLKAFRKAAAEGKIRGRAGEAGAKARQSVCENSVLEGHGFSCAVNSLRASGLLAPEGIFYQRTREFGGWKKRTSAANLSRLAVEAAYGNVIYGTAEPVPFQDRVLTHALIPAFRVLRRL
jgi:hypothetical protein